MTDELTQRSQALIEQLGLGSAKDLTDVKPLTGGVSSDILLIRVAGKYYCAKFALAQLRVEENWSAPVRRNLAEYRWLEYASKVQPGSVPELLGRSEQENGFLMEYIQGDDIHLWKTDLLAGLIVPERSVTVARLIAKIHCASRRPEFDASLFQNQADFYELRLAPYFEHLKTAHPDLKPAIENLIAGFSQAPQALVHGDVSPKNILFRGAQPILLDAECATMGDPLFDAAFCVNHLLLKAVHLPESRAELVSSARLFCSEYAKSVDWMDETQVYADLAKWLPFLLLARVDGKSPVEYLSEGHRQKIRELSRSLILRADIQLENIFNEIGAIS